MYIRVCVCVAQGRHKKWKHSSSRHKL